MTALFLNRCRERFLFGVICNLEERTEEQKGKRGIVAVRFKKFCPYVLLSLVPNYGSPLLYFTGQKPVFPLFCFSGKVK